MRSAEPLLPDDADIAAFAALLVGDTGNACGKTVMASIEQLRTGIEGLKASVSDLVEHVNAAANRPVGISEADLEPLLAEITDLKVTVDAVLEANAGPAATSIDHQAV